MSAVSVSMTAFPAVNPQRIDVLSPEMFAKETKTPAYVYCIMYTLRGASITPILSVQYADFEDVFSEAGANQLRADGARSHAIGPRQRHFVDLSTTF